MNVMSAGKSITPHNTSHTRLTDSESRKDHSNPGSWRGSEGAGGGGKLKIVPYTMHQLSFGDIQEDVPGLYDRPFPWENTFGFRLAGMVGHDFFKPYAVTFDFDTMQIFLP
jgi:hypothetical protein